MKVIDASSRCKKAMPESNLPYRGSRELTKRRGQDKHFSETKNEK